MLENWTGEGLKDNETEITKRAREFESLALHSSIEPTIDRRGIRLVLTSQLLLVKFSSTYPAVVLSK